MIVMKRINSPLHSLGGEKSLVWSTQRSYPSLSQSTEASSATNYVWHTHSRYAELNYNIASHPLGALTTRIS